MVYQYHRLLFDDIKLCGSQSHLLHEQFGPDEL